VAVLPVLVVSENLVSVARYTYVGVDGEGVGTGWEIRIQNGLISAKGAEAARPKLASSRTAAAQAVSRRACITL